eukprot:3319431-Rhodomonas_salina.2
MMTDALAESAVRKMQETAVVLVHDVISHELPPSLALGVRSKIAMFPPTRVIEAPPPEARFDCLKPDEEAASILPTEAVVKI